MNRKDVVIGFLLGLCLALTLFAVVPTQGQSGEYDTWADLNDDGYINAKDAIQLGIAFGTSGDPAKNVTVTNWPVKRDVEVWYNRHLPPDLYSITYNASGFGYLHVLAHSTGLGAAPAHIDIPIYGLLWRSDHGAHSSIVVYKIQLNSTNYAAYVTIPVPSETFFFRAYYLGLPPGANVSLSFYLTWA